MDIPYPNFSNMEAEEITKLVDGVYKVIIELIIFYIFVMFSHIV